VKNTTYILGAGASCYSQPLVYNMKERMLSLLELLNPDSRLHQKYISNTLKGQTQSLYNKYENILKEAVKHYTPDTYAKKLHLTSEKTKLTILKEFLNLYFLFEQDYLKDAYNVFPEDPYKIGPQVYSLDSNQTYNKYSPTLIDEDKVKQIWKDISNPIDYRYDVFYATLLEAFADDKLALPPNVNILSWNYDNQLELAFNEYENLELEGIDLQLNINPNDYDLNKSHIIKLNGSCNRIYIDKDKKVQELTFLKAIELLLENKTIHNNIYFAWETIGIDRKWSAINQIMLLTRKLVIIGYSFPNFNSDTDVSIFQNVSPNCEIIIQVPTIDEYTRIKERVLKRGPFIDAGQIKHIIDRDQFYIPF